MNRRTSILSHRPKTSSAVDDAPPKPFDTDMKRTASQTFTLNNPPLDAATAMLPLGPVHENMRAEYPLSLSHQSQHSQSSSLSRASQVLAGSYKQICRRLSTSSNRRPSLHSIMDGPLIHTGEKSVCRADYPRLHLQHHDSGIPTQQMEAPPAPHSKFSIKQRFGSIRHRRPAASGPSGDFARYNPVPAPIPSNYPPILSNCPPPGHAARQAAAAANSDRITQQRRDQEQTQQFLAGHLVSTRDEVIKDSESGVGMTCSSPITRTDSVQEKKLDPVQILPAEIATIVFSNLDAASLICAETVSKLWHEAASSPHVWRVAFLRKFEPEVHVSPTPIMMGGAGIGKFTEKGKPAPGQDWKTMYKVRMTINRRWRGCRPAAVYLNGHTDSVYCCQFDENKIITGSRDRTIRVWDMKTYECTKVIGGPSHRPVINTPPQLETHKEMVINNPSLNGTQTGSDIYHIPADYHDASILCLQYDKKIMVTGSSDHTCIVWDITGDDYRPMYRLRGHSAGVLDVCLDEKHIISCSKDASIMVWDRATGRHIRSLKGHRGPVNAVQLRGHLLVSASGDGVAKLWNLESGACIKEFPSQDRGLAAVEFSDDAKTVLAGGNDHVVYKFCAVTGQLLHTSQKHGGLVRSLFLDAHNGRVISGSYDQSIRVADFTTGEVWGTYENWTTSWILSAKSDYRRVVATSQDGRALVLDFGWGVSESEGVCGTQTEGPDSLKDGRKKGYEKSWHDWGWEWLLTKT